MSVVQVILHLRDRDGEIKIPLRFVEVTEDEQDEHVQQIKGWSYDIFSSPTSSYPSYT